MLEKKILSINKLSPNQIKSMFSLMEKYYLNLSKDKFTDDLKEKDGVMIIFDKDKNIAGFSTYMLFDFNYNNDIYKILFSGDTIVDQKYWGGRIQFRVFAQLIDIIMKSVTNKLFWLLISKGYRTYLILPLFFKIFYPSYTDDQKHYFDFTAKLAEYKFGSKIYSSEGVLLLKSNADFLNEQTAEIPVKRVTDPNVKFFIEKNKNYKTGEELICLAEINKDNFTDAFNRFIK